MYDALVTYKYLTPEQLIKLLRLVPEKSRITINSAGGLVILDPFGSRYTGYVDFIGEGRVRMYEGN